VTARHVRSQLFELALVRAYPFFGPLGGRESAELTGWTISEGGHRDYEAGAALAKIDCELHSHTGAFLQADQRPSTLI
jgi:hypothetical protein